jgi:aminoglycoside 6'-N-acetyltransferase I
MIRLVHAPISQAPLRAAMAQLLVSGFAGRGPQGWKDREAAEAEVAAFDAPDRVALAAELEGKLVGWIGAIMHSSALWELHPLVVHPDFRGRGVASHLLAALEEEAWRRGVLTLWLGCDDDYGGTNIFGVDVYPDIPGAIRHLEAHGTHPFTFYRKHGFTVVGLLPDATGLGKHDILMAKRLEEESETE